MKLRRLWAIARKEGLHVIRDWRSLVLALLIPLIMVLLYGYALTLDLRDVPMTVWDQSRSVQSRELLSLFQGSPYFTFIDFPDNYRDMQTDLDRGRAMAALIIPSDFSSKVKSGTPVQIQVITDGSDANTSRLVTTYVTVLSNIYGKKVSLSRVRRNGREPVRPAVDLLSRVWYNPDLRSQNVLVPGIVALVMIVVAAMLTSVTVAREWETGTMEQLISTPLHRSELIFGKVLPYFVIGMVDVLIAVTIGRLVFHVPIVGSSGLLFAFSALFLSGALFFGMTLSIVMKSQVLANQTAILAGFLPTLILSGFVFAIQDMPLPLQFVTYIVPGRYFIAILRGIYLKGIGFDILWVDGMLLGIYTLIMIVLAHRKLKFKLE
ncbi:MAG: ABC transporter permease [Deltaproteobacteria bacterium]|nr:ABC transporter permease [Deltaproteobacteria bacterium]